MFMIEAEFLHASAETCFHCGIHPKKNSNNWCYSPCLNYGAIRFCIQDSFTWSSGPHRSILSFYVQPTTHNINKWQNQPARPLPPKPHLQKQNEVCLCCCTPSLGQIRLRYNAFHLTCTTIVCFLFFSFTHCSSHHSSLTTSSCTIHLVRRRPGLKRPERQKYSRRQR